jgi:hypothetical protein
MPAMKIPDVIARVSMRYFPIFGISAKSAVVLDKSRLVVENFSTNVFSVPES